MHGTATRRQILQGMGALAVGLASGSPLAALSGARVHSKRVISMQPRLYHGWPTLARRRNGELLLVCSGGRESHVCPFGRVELMRSRDGGRHWSFPRVLIDGPIDDRDAGVVETAEGRCWSPLSPRSAMPTSWPGPKSWNPKEKASGPERNWSAGRPFTAASRPPSAKSSWGAG